jgi:hypothetical protein
MMALEQPGEELTVSSQECCITFDENGKPTNAYLEPGAGSLLYYRDGKFKKVQRVKIPANAVAGAAQRNKQGYRDPNRSVYKPKQKPAIENAVCAFCTKEGHPVYQCDAFTKTSMRTRLEFVREHKLCFRCLTKGHPAKDCKVKFLCDVDNCGKRHHRLLHPNLPNSRFYALIAEQGLVSDISDFSGDE